MHPYKDYSQQHIQVRGFSQAVRVATWSFVATKGRAQVLRSSSVPRKTFLVVKPLKPCINLFYSV